MALFLLWPQVRGATIFQGATSTYVAWEAEDTFAIVNAAPTTWISTNDATAGGGRALYGAGANGTAAPSSLASYAIRFRAAGTYTLYFTWRADKAFTDLDPNSGNSYFRPNTLGDLGPDAANYAASSINNSRTPPAVNSYAMSAEGITYTVTEEEVAAGLPVILKLGTREAGLFIDRLVLSLNALTEAEFNALANSDTDIIPQGLAETYVAFEAERVTRITNGTPTQWAVTNDATASGNQALYGAGANGTVAPSGFATYTIRFRSAGTYTLFLRWRADKAFTDLDPNSGNSYFRPNTLGDLGPEAANYSTASINNSRTPPAVNSYAVSAEGNTYTVTEEEVAAGVPLILKLGTREAGLLIDRIILSQNVLTEAEFNALPNSGSVARPGLVKAVGSASLTTVKVTFDRPLAAGSVAATNFTLSGGVTVTAATLDPNTSKDVLLTTTAQAQSTNYVVTVNNVTDVSSNAIAPNSRISFHAWKIASGWITRELYFNVAGNTVGDLQFSPNFPDNPSSVDFVRTVSVGADLQGANYGARFRGFFVPPQSGVYEFYLYADEEATLALSPDETAGNLAIGVQTLGPSSVFDPAVSMLSGNLNAGQRYLFEVVYKQGAGAAAVGLAARRAGTTGEVVNLPLLGGAQVSTFVNPDAAAVNITRQPASGTIPAGQRARLVVTATAPLGGALFYQWQVDGVNIPGATRPTYVTPILTAADTGKRYRVVIGVNGADVPSQEATITVGAPLPAALEPYVGINFAGGGGAGTTPGAALGSNDIAGVVLQGNWNNIAGATVDGTQVLVNAQGTATPVTVAVYDPINLLVVNAGGLVGTGTGASDTSADHLLMQGSIINNNLPVSILFSGVPSGTYALIAYSVGFSFNSTYEEDFDLLGASAYPKLTVRGQTSTEFIANPIYVRASSTNSEARDRGNYIQFDNVSPALDGTLLLTLTPASTNVGNTAYFPPLNALQLVTMAAPRPSLGVLRQTGNTSISWGAEAAGYTLESTTTVAVTNSWTTVTGVPNPITAAGSITAGATPAAQYYRLRK